MEQNIQQSAAGQQKKWHNIILIIIGLMLIFLPNFSKLASVAFEFILGWLFAVAGGIQLLVLIISKEKKDFSIWVMAIALLMAGSYFLINPNVISNFMAIIFALITAINGLTNIFQSFAYQEKSRAALLVNGVLGLIFAAMIYFNWPASGASFIGIIFGLYLLISGLGRLLIRKS